VKRKKCRKGHIEHEGHLSIGQESLAGIVNMSPLQEKGGIRLYEH
jgi:hypothetical protein